MALSGTQKTRIGASLSGAGKKLTITAKAASGVTNTVMIFGRGLMRAINRGLVR